MAREFPWSWKEVVAIVVLSGTSLFILFSKSAPAWLRVSVGVIVYVGPFLPILALIPWHFIAKHRGLMGRSTIPCVVSCTDGVLSIEQGKRHTSHSLDRIVRGRFARNDNWTESKMLEDALRLFASNGREIVRVPESAKGFDSVLAELRARGIPIEYVDVSAPALLD